MGLGLGFGLENKDQKKIKGTTKPLMANLDITSVPGSFVPPPIDCPTYCVYTHHLHCTERANSSEILDKVLVLAKGEWVVPARGE